MRTIQTILLTSILSAAPMAAGAKSAPVPPLTITRHPEKRITPPDPKAMEAATREVNSALTHFRRTANELRIAFESSPEYTSAMSALIEARVKLDQARQASLASVRAESAYVQRKLSIEKLETQLAALRMELHTTDVTLTATELLHLRAALTRMEAKALEADPAISNLRQQYLDAAAMVSALRENFTQDLRKSAEWQLAKANYEHAVRQRVTIR